MMAFIWIALVYVIVAFADITAGSFVSAVDEIKGTKVDFNPGGAVAAASIFYLHLPFAIRFGATAFSTFVFDTIDVATRLGRYLIQELTGLRTPFGATLATLITVGVPALILSMAGEGFFSTRTHGRSRRRALTSSRNRVSSFYRSSSSLRAVSHCSSEAA